MIKAAAVGDLYRIYAFTRLDDIALNTRRLLVEEGGFPYDSDAYNDELPYWTTVGDASHLVIPYAHVNNDLKTPNDIATAMRRVRPDRNMKRSIRKLGRFYALGTLGTRR